MEMKALNARQTLQVNGGWSYWKENRHDNNNTFSTVVRHAGKGAIGGALAGPKGALAGAALGIMSGFSAANGNQ